MQGAITNRDVLVHGLTILRHFGLAAYWRCVRALIRHDAPTFLDALYGDGADPSRRGPAAS